MYQDQQKAHSPRRINFPNPDTHARNLQHTIKSLEDEIQLTIYNYQNILQTQKKNSSQRSQFLLYLIQSLRTRHLQQLQTLNSQIQTAEGQRQSVQAMQKQMENIGDGLDQITQQNKKLKTQNLNLNKQLQQLDIKEKELDQQIDAIQRQLQDCRLKIDDWQRIKIKWNRHKKQLLEMIEDAEKQVHIPSKSQENQQNSEESLCEETGTIRKLCEHCQKIKIEQLKIKYNNHINSNNYNININGLSNNQAAQNNLQYRKST